MSYNRDYPRRNTGVYYTVLSLVAGLCVLLLAFTAVRSGVLTFPFAGARLTVEQPGGGQTQKGGVQDRGAEAPKYQPARIDLQPAKPVITIQTTNQGETQSQNEHVQDRNSAITTLPNCSTGQTPCVFSYGQGIGNNPDANLATGGVNTGTDGNPQKDE